MPSQGSEKNLQSALGSGSEGKNLISHSILYCSSFFIVLFYSNSPVPLLASPSVFFPLHPSLKKKKTSLFRSLERRKKLQELSFIGQKHITRASIKEPSHLLWQHKDSRLRD